MKITRRDLEAFFKKECQFNEGKIYLDDIQIEIYTQNNALYFDCPQLVGLLKFYLYGKKHIKFNENGLCFTHPLCKFDKVKVEEDSVEITFK